jgi:glycolate oxidase FAD binding subunit
VRYVTPLAEPRDRQVWRLSIPPASGPDCVAALALQGLADGVLYDWNCGLIWLALPPADDANAASIRAAVLNHGGGHATLVRAAAEVRARIPVFQPQPGALGALTERLRRQFDPSGVLNPGRMAPG